MSLQLSSYDLVGICVVVAALVVWVRDLVTRLDKMYDKCDAQDEALWFLFEHFERPEATDEDKKVLEFCRKTIAGYGEDADS